MIYLNFYVTDTLFGLQHINAKSIFIQILSSLSGGLVICKQCKCCRQKNIYNKAIQTKIHLYHEYTHFNQRQ